MKLSKRNIPGLKFLQIGLLAMVILSISGFYPEPAYEPVSQVNSEQLLDTQEAEAFQIDLSGSSDQFLDLYVFNSAITLAHNLLTSVQLKLFPNHYNTNIPVILPLMRYSSEGETDPPLFS